MSTLTMIKLQIGRLMSQVAQDNATIAYLRERRKELKIKIDNLQADKDRLQARIDTLQAKNANYVTALGWLKTNYPNTYDAMKALFDV